MKNLITITMLLLIVIACKQENNALNKLEKAADKVKGAEDFQENVEKLSELRPLSKEAYT